MTAHLIHKETYDALGQGITLVRVRESGQYVPFDKDGITLYWSTEVEEDMAILLQDPATVHFGATMYLVNDSGMDQTFTAAGTEYTVPSGTDAEVRVSIRNGVNAYVAAYYYTPS